MPFGFVGVSDDNIMSKKYEAPALWSQMPFGFVGVSDPPHLKSLTINAPKCHFGGRQLFLKNEMCHPVSNSHIPLIITNLKFGGNPPLFPFSACRRTPLP